MEKSFATLAYEILFRAGPEGMHYRKLTEQILRLKPTKGKTPEQTVLAALERDPRFERVSRGVYRVKQQAPPEKIAAAAAAAEEEETKPSANVSFLQEFAFDEATNILYIKDNRTGRIAGVRIKADGFHCDVDDRNDCEHVGFALSLPVVKKMLDRAGAG